MITKEQKKQEADKKRILRKKNTVFNKVWEFVFGPRETKILSIEGPYVYYRGPAPTHNQIKEFKDRT